MNRHIQIIGFSRTGTTLMLRLLHQSLNGFKVDAGERTLGLSIQQSGNCVGKRPMDLMEYKLNKSIALSSGKKVNFILMQRDIRDVITSFHHHVPGHYFTGYDFTFHVNGPNSFSPTEPGIGVQIESYNRFKQDSDTVVIKYEDLVSNPEMTKSTLENLLSFDFNMDFNKLPENEVEFFRKNNANKKINANSIGRWKMPEHTKRIIDQFSNYPELFDLLKSDGYEDSNSWFEKL